MELPNIAAYAYQDVHVWSALMTCCGPLGGGNCHLVSPGVGGNHRPGGGGMDKGG